MKELCPICSSTLLRHLHQREIAWFCPRCRQEMPNLDFGRVGTRRRNFLQQRINLDRQGKAYVQRTTTTKAKIVDEQLIIDSFINEGKKRLEVVSFILSQINSIVLNIHADNHPDATQKKSQLNEPETKIVYPNKLPLVDFLRDSEIIILHICQAILARDVSLLNERCWQGLKANYAKLHLPVEPIICLIYLIKTSVVDFISSMTFDSSESLSHQNVRNLVCEVASYFDVVIASMI